MNSRALLAALLLLGANSAAPGQGAGAAHAGNSPLLGKYVEATTLLTKGDLAQATLAYKLFLAEILHRVANGRAETGEYPEAAPLFDEALKLDPANGAISFDSAAAALGAHDLPKAERIGKELLATYPKGLRGTPTSRLHWLLGQVLLGMDDNMGARDEFAQAVAANPSFENQYALAQAYLALLDKDSAARLFAKMLAQFGDSARIHMQFGLAFARADFSEQAIPEFRKALALDNTMRDAHYCLGAAYLSRSGDTAFAQAEPEFHKELALHPDDFFSYYELGYEAMKLNHLDEAVTDLSRAATLNRRSDDTFLLLGELYGDLNRTSDEETALRAAIRVCTDPSRGHYQIRGAHYQLGQLLMQEGKTEEAKEELQIAQQLLLENRALDKANMTGEPILRFPSPQSDTAADPEALARLQAFEQQVGPPIADSFNNLGVISAQEDDFIAADDFFKQAAAWNPSMEGLDYNWGRAAFGAKDYRQAVTCLTRYMQSHPSDDRVRVPLGMSQFQVADYRSAVGTLAPISAQLNAVPLMDYAYAVSLVKTGDMSAGVSRLEQLEAGHPDLEIVPLALGAAYADEKQYGKSEAELRKAVLLAPSDLHAKDDLVLALLAQGRNDEAKTLLLELTKLEPDNPGLFYQLGKLYLDHRELKNAVANLRIAAKLAPQDNAIKQELLRAAELQSQADHTTK
jgi:tetratricopeptide (TPR) repeat protein